ncbi:hypothetical protein ACXG8O_004014 [Citrobacter youngae]
MLIDEERLDMIVQAIGAAVVQIIADGNELSRSTLIAQLERNRQCDRKGRE